MSFTIDNSKKARSIINFVLNMAMEQLGGGGNEWQDIRFQLRFELGSVDDAKEKEKLLVLLHPDSRLQYRINEIRIATEHWTQAHRISP